MAVVKDERSKASASGSTPGGVDSIVNGLDCLWFAEAGALTPARRLELPATWAHEAAGDAASLRARLQELFRGGFVSLDRMRSHSAS